ncbi:hypothetical protein EC973_006456 [Apophysomyces ossiformis]|uniref:Rho-GAP domain-containing protein n=1 Tax=Apophysomyces ossiformis TaxID=679940 RepID=A0A8H7BW21_9FUNG|nr:hypothetical protein EC973_006456 [Apophysomyces ossiformis]
MTTAFPVDDELEKQVYAHSATIDGAMKSSLKDIDKLAKYLQQRIELEEGYQENLARIILDLKAPDKDTKHTQGIQKPVNDYIHMSDALQTARTEFIQTMKTQLKTLTQLKEQQDRLRRQHKKNMMTIGTQYLQTRTQELPLAREAYTQKWEEIDRYQSSTGNVISPISPSTPVAKINRSTSITGTMSEAPKHEESDRGTFSMDDERSSAISLAMAANSIHNKPAEGTAQSPHRRIERFMNKFSYLTHHHDHSRHNVRVAKLKVEAHEADVHYRKVIRRLDLLNKKHKAANEYSLSALQSQLLEKSSVMKEVLNVMLSIELKQIKRTQEAIQSMQANVSAINPEEERRVFDEALKAQNFPEVLPIYYIHHQLGICKDLIFGMSLLEYAQQRGRSPPLIVIKCIEAIERLGGLQKEGIYRISGKQSNIEKIKRSFERDEESLVFGENDVPEDVFSIASTLKVYLRELETPLFPFTLADRVTYSQTDKELRLMNLLTRILKLPTGNYDTLKALVEHLVKLEGFVEKNKMSVKNLSLIFTPAIFQDHNQARSPGEWYADCVLEDLLLNHRTLFAEKDLHGASAITGKIDYGFERGQEDELNLPSPDSDDSPAEYERDVSKKSLGSLREQDSIATVNRESIPTQTSSLATINTPSELPTADPSPPIKKPNPSSQQQPRGTDRQKKFRTVSQDRGLKVDTRVSQSQNSSVYVEQDTERILSDSPIEADDIQQVSITTASATVASFGWLPQAAETGVSIDNHVTSLHRSSTTGKSAASKRKPDVTPATPVNIS